LIYGVADGGEAGREVTGADGFADDAGPEAGERFVVAAGCGVGGTDGFVVMDDARPGKFQCTLRRMFVGQAGGDGDVSGVGPGRFRQSAGLPLAEDNDPASGRFRGTDGSCDLGRCRVRPFDSFRSSNQIITQMKY
jgi:hypothetical protein